MTESTHNDAMLRLGSVTIRNINTFQEELAGMLDESGPVRIDGSAVERVDTAMLQLLVAFVRDVQADSRAVQWAECSAPLRRAASSLGLESMLGLPADRN